MYKVNVRIKGTAPLLQHKFPLKTLDALQQGATKRTASPDYSLEWMDTITLLKACESFESSEGQMLIGCRCSVEV